MADSASILGKFHSDCGQGVKLSEDRLTADGRKHSGIYSVFSNDSIPNGLKFSVKILQQDAVSPISTSSRPPTSDAPYTAAGAVHVVHCCLFVVYRAGVGGT